MSEFMEGFIVGFICGPIVWIILIMSLEQAKRPLPTDNTKE